MALGRLRNSNSSASASRKWKVFEKVMHCMSIIAQS